MNTSCLPVRRLFLGCSLQRFPLTQSAPIAQYADFGTATFSGRISNIDIAEGQYGEFLAVTVLHNVSKDKTVSVVFNDSKLIGLYNSGKLPVGRRVTIVGRIADVSETYFDKQSGQTMMRKRPQITLKEVSIPTGGLGQMPRSEQPVRAPKQGMVVTTQRQAAPVDEAPQLETANVGAESAEYGQNSLDENGFPQF